MADTTATQTPTAPNRITTLLRLLWRDKFATASAVFLLLVAILAILGPALIGELASKMALRQRNLPPGSLDAGWAYVLGADNLGRSILARLVVEGRISPPTARRIARDLVDAIPREVFKL